MKTNSVQSIWFLCPLLLTSLPVSCIFGYNPLDPKVCRVNSSEKKKRKGVQENL